ncbi:MAG: UDP-glucose 6-dehydrogenase, partial [Lachnospiraceae bacterium]|nr:UDP-glucose 6-dehydrogenase [Lachnospiraceae bacterium]
VYSAQKTSLFEKAIERMISFNGLKLAVLGLTFKSGTDDLREAPSIDNLKLLLSAGAEIYAYDPKGTERSKQLFPEGKNDKGSINYVSTPKEALTGAHICFIFTEWPEIKEIRPKDFKDQMHTPLVYDGRNLYNPAEMKTANVEYYSIGR